MSKRNAAIVFTCLFLAATSYATQPTVTITPSRITATGISPGGRVLFFGTGFEPKGYHAEIHRWSVVMTDSSLAGTVFYDLSPAVTWNVLWIVVDIDSGHYSVAATPGFPVVRAFLPRGEFRRGGAAAVETFAYSRATADILYIMPGAAWTLKVRDGESTDSDVSRDGATGIDVGRLQPLVSGIPAPTAFLPGGTLFLIDPARLDLLELNIDAPLLAGAH
ncbi:MAG: hypothetical protein QOI58_3824 [Thermoanaerobaculia bacterium]|jgi:hypothetical protein|nr:hypothetical protein [Thermoanaerobaculia bacterium]